MGTGRLEAFSDGVLAIVITIMVLELKTPEGSDLAAFGHAVPGLLTYLLSFVYVGIYWNNHHHLLHLCSRVDGWVLWANLHLLFWLSLLPFTTAWIDDTRLAQVPMIVYGADLLLAAVAYYVLQLRIIRAEGEGSVLREALGRDWKGKASPALYVLGIALTWLSTGLAMVPLVAAALLWFVPDRRIEAYAGRRVTGVREG